MFVPACNSALTLSSTLSLVWNKFVEPSVMLSEVPARPPSVVEKSKVPSLSSYVTVIPLSVFPVTIAPTIS